MPLNYCFLEIAFLVHLEFGQGGNANLEWELS